MWQTEGCPACEHHGRAYGQSFLPSLLKLPQYPFAMRLFSLKLPQTQERLPREGKDSGLPVFREASTLQQLCYPVQYGHILAALFQKAHPSSQLDLCFSPLCLGRTHYCVTASLPHHCPLSLPCLFNNTDYTTAPPRGGKR